MPTRRSHRVLRAGPRVWIPVFLAGALVTGSGLALGWSQTVPDPGLTPRPVVYRAGAPGPVVVPQRVFRPVTAAELGLRRHPATAVPVRLLVPALGIRAPVVSISDHAGTLVPPSDPQTLGWWSEGARPGARFGSALVAGHTVSSGGGAFDDLATLRVGDRVVVGTRKGVIRYAVSAVAVYHKASLARHSKRVFDQGVPGRLVLVTCDDWNGVRYLSNAVVRADPVYRSAGNDVG